MCDDYSHCFLLRYRNPLIKLVNVENVCGIDPLVNCSR